MINPEDIAERFWSLAQKPSEEARREQFFLDDVIHKAHVEREIEARLEGVETALDVGVSQSSQHAVLGSAAKPFRL